MILLKTLFTHFNIDALTIGALAAVALYAQPSFLKLFASTPLFLIFAGAAIFLIVMNIQVPYMNSLLYSSLFGIIILCLVYNCQLEQLFENKVFNYLGKISYGLYMYHQILIVLSINFLTTFNIDCMDFIDVLSVILTIIAVAISYRYLEKPFLRKKSKLSAFNNSKP